MDFRKGKVFVESEWAGTLEETESGYRFSYRPNYLALPEPSAVSLSLPLRSESYASKVMFPFFDGLIPEGWLLAVAQKTWKVDARDRMGLILACCADCIGNVSVIPDGAPV